MADYMQKYADKEVEKLGRKIGRTYRQAAKEIEQKMKSFWDAHKAISEKMLQDVKDGKITQQDYKDWLRNQVFRGDRWKSKLDEVTKAYREADEKARKMVGDKNKDIFAHAANWQAKDTSRAVNGAVSFDMYDRKTVDRLIRDNPKMLPEWKINEKKDYIWNEKRVQNAVAQGIVQGESVYDIGKRLTGELAASNASKMDMFARTAVTGAQNAGRMERLHEAEEMGIKVRKKWLSAHDARVRDAHAELDGVEVDVDEPFHNEYGDIMYPGDPAADPANVYNCRCTLIYVYPKYESKPKTVEKEEEHQTEKETENEGNAGYQYHATKASSLIGIAENGLRPSRGHVGEGVYFADNVEDALEWTSETSTGGRTVLRVSENYLKKSKLEKYAAKETGYGIAESVFDGIVPLEDIEIKVNDNGDEDDWWSLAQYLKNSKSKYAQLNKKTQRKIDKIVDEEFDKRWR